MITVVEMTIVINPEQVGRAQQCSFFCRRILGKANEESLVCNVIRTYLSPVNLKQIQRQQVKIAFLKPSLEAQGNTNTALFTLDPFIRYPPYLRLSCEA